MRFYTRDDVAAFGTFDFLYIRVSFAGHMLRITLNRPEKRNAFNNTMAEEIVFALAFAKYNADVRCVIINAEGLVFCAGADLSAFHDNAANSVNPKLPAIREEVRLGDAFSEVHKPCMAVVQGPVLAGGFLIICGCHFVLSTQEATFSLPEVKRGLWPMQVMASLLKILPPRRALEMAITARSYNALEAQSMGLVTDVFRDDEILEKAEQLALEVVENAPLAIQKGLEAYSMLANMPQDQQHTYLKAELDKLLLSQDAAEGIRAFGEKRKPNWRAQ
ncbi:enoyl-CoA hydratase/isomerase family protein [Dyadobacter sandarakinus]|uniref:Enoyl-CoA hydratase/isomerase family protein n=1 Tax=Dyadobacter sandarakinus TaxID=2747268 RepID=A0ABX7I942_9BACT|nr:enoyl-CoA hydratase-related protein [Dyadobacter sandarakinus]QRR02233.1 enoyl-CoA hydratase/isomerase family protein [Dyadobacter sandarakinus]